MTRTAPLNGVQAEAAVIKLQTNPNQEYMRVCSFDHDDIDEKNGNFLCKCERVKKTIKNYEYDKDAIFKLKYRGNSGLPYIPESKEGDEYLVMEIKKVMAENKENKLFVSNVVAEVKKKVFLCDPHSRIRRLFERATKEMETSSSDDNSNKECAEIRANLAVATRTLANTTIGLDNMRVRIAGTNENLDKMGVRLDGTIEAVDKLGKEAKRQQEQLVGHTKQLDGHTKQLDEHEGRLTDNEFRQTATERKLNEISRQLARSEMSYAAPTQLFDGDATPVTKTPLPVAYGNSNTSVTSVAPMAAAPQMVTPATLGGSIPRPATINSVAPMAAAQQIVPPATLGGSIPPPWASPPGMTTPTTTISSIGGSMEPNSDVGTLKVKKPPKSLKPKIAIQYYAKEGYLVMNGALRSDQPTNNPDVNQWIKFTEDYLKNSPEKFSGIVYRGVRGKTYQLIKDQFVQGKTYSDRAFLSTSKKAIIAPAFSNSSDKSPVLLMVIKARGVAGVDISKPAKRPNEDEVLFLPGTKFIITNVLQQDNKEKVGRVIVHMEELGDAAGTVGAVNAGPCGSCDFCRGQNGVQGI